jgi:hypothetical protein
VNPGKDGCKIFWGQRGAEQTVKNHQRRRKQQGNLQDGARMPPAQKTAEDRNAK